MKTYTKTSITLLSTILILFTGCKEKTTVHTETIQTENLTATVSIPEYLEYKEFSDFISNSLMKDFKKYENEAKSYDDSIPFSYRLEFTDNSNSKYLNCIVKKYLYSGTSLEDEYILCFVWNKKLKKQETIESLTGLSLEEIAQKCEEELFLQVKNEFKESDYPFIQNWIKNGTQPKQMYYTGFTADKKYVTIFFSKGQVLSNWYGTRSVKLPLAKK